MRAPRGFWPSFSVVLLLVGCQKVFGDFRVDGSAFAGKSTTDGAAGTEPGSSGSAAMGRECVDDQTQCAGQVLQVCNANHDGWTNQRICASKALCDADHGTCKDPVCDSGTFRCDGAVLQACSATLDTWNSVKTCDSAAQCSSASGECMAEPCKVDSFQCNGSTLEQCKADHTGWGAYASCDTPALCDATLGMCRSADCAPSDYDCAGESLYGCNAGRTGFVKLQSCDRAELCNKAAGRCSVCVHGALRCDQMARLYRCADDGMSESIVESCDSQQHCLDGTGVGRCVVCNAGERRCEGAMLLKCDADRLGFTSEDCGDAALCDATAGVCQPSGAGGAP